MTIEDLRRWRDAEPFVPFRIIPTDGPAVDVTEPRDIDFSVCGTMCIIWGHPAGWTMIDLSHVVQVEPIPPAPSS